jgi:hypothetical protein
MTEQERIKHAYELMVKNNPDEAVKQLLLKDKMIINKRKTITKAIEYINENWEHWCSNHCKYATETINILRGKDNDK